MFKVYMGLKSKLCYLEVVFIQFFLLLYVMSDYAKWTFKNKLPLYNQYSNKFWPRFIQLKVWSILN